MSVSVSSVSSVKAYSSNQGQPVKFQVHLDKSTTASQTIKFTLEQPSNKQNGGLLDNNDYYFDPTKASPYQPQEITGVVNCSNGVTIDLKTDTIYIPKGVKNFNLDFQTNPKLHETLERIGIDFKSGNTDIVASASVIQKLVYNDNYWWRSTPWFNNEMGTISKQIINNPQSFTSPVITAFKNFQNLPANRTYFAFCSAVESYLTLKDKIIFSKNAVTENGKVLTSRQDIPAPKSDSKEIMVFGDSLSDEELTGIGSWTRSLRKDVEVKNHAQGWHVWNLATGSAPTYSASDPFNAYYQLKGALKVNPHPGIIIINIGVNNYRLGISIEQSMKDLKRLLSLAYESGAKVILVGTHLPPGSIAQERPKTLWNPHDLKTFKKDGLYKKLEDKTLTYSQCYSQAFQIMMDNVATENKNDPKFYSVKDFWTPMKSNYYIRDHIHPKHQASIEDALAKPIEKIVDMLI